MVRVLISSLRYHRWLRYFFAALVLTSAGSGITYIVVFGELLRLHASPSSLALTFAFSTAPGYLGSRLGERLLSHKSPFAVLVLGEAIGLAGLTIPYAGGLLNSVPLLQMAELASAFAGGLTIPAVGLISKVGLRDSELETASAIESTAFASNVLVGVGLATILFHFLNFQYLLIVDAVSYVLSMSLFAWTSGVFSSTFPPREVEEQSAEQALTARQWRSIFILPALTMVGSPAMALLPALAAAPDRISSDALGLGFLFARSLGQLIGPFLLPVNKIKTDKWRSLIVFSCLGGFLICYAVFPFVGNLYLSEGLVLFAHVLSNVVFALGWYVLLADFQAEQVGRISAKAYRMMVVIGALMSVISGVVADGVGPWTALLVCSGTGYLIASFLLFGNELRQLGWRKP